MRLSSLCLLALLLLDCRPDAPPPAPVYQVPAEVEPYIQAFRYEAQKRGKAITIDNLIVEFGQTSREDVCGACRLQSGKTPRITLSQESLCWSNVYTETREGLVFHELGHCVLGRREHKTARLPNGDYASLMNGEDVGLYAPCTYPISNKPCDLRSRRTYYLDELFNENTPVPSWGQ